MSVCLDKVLSSGIFEKQIKRLIIGIDRNRNDLCTIVKICTCIFRVFVNLTDLKFCESWYENALPLLFDVPFRSFSSSNLLELNLKVQSFSNLLYLVDGRFSQLHTLIVDLNNIVYQPKHLENKVSLKRKEIRLFFAFSDENLQSETFCSLVCVGNLFL